MDRLTDFRQVYAQMVVSRAGCRDASLLRAFSTVPRHEFMSAGPWYVSEHGDPTPSADPALVYHDMAMGLAPERGITTGQPSLHARCMAACAPRKGDHVIHIGAGAGYYTAILAELVGEEGRVTAFEIDEPLAATASENLRRWPWVQVVSGSGARAALQGADIVYVCAGVQQLPRAWVDALRPGGRLAFPLTPAGELGGMLLVRNVGIPRIFLASFICRCQFIPCIGTQDEQLSRRLSAAFLAGGHDSVRSLRFSPEEPDESAWFAGDGWWLSTEATQG